MAERSGRAVHVSTDKGGLSVSLVWYDRDDEGHVECGWKHVTPSDVTVLENVRKLFNKLDSKYYLATMTGDRLAIIYDIPYLLESTFDDALQSEAPMNVFAAVLGSSFVTHKAL